MSLLLRVVSSLYKSQFYLCIVTISRPVSSVWLQCLFYCEWYPRCIRVNSYSTNCYIVASGILAGLFVALLSPLVSGILAGLVVLSHYAASCQLQTTNNQLHCREWYPRLLVVALFVDWRDGILARFVVLSLFTTTQLQLQYCGIQCPKRV